MLFTYLHWVRGLRLAKNREGGFTLLEVIISLAIIATALVALLSLQSRSMSMMKSAEMFEGARLIAERLMAEGELKGVPNGEIKGAEGNYNWTLTELRLTPDTMPEGVKVLTGRQVSFDIVWMEGKKEERLSFAEYIYEK